MNEKLAEVVYYYIGNAIFSPNGPELYARIWKKWMRQYSNFFFPPSLLDILNNYRHKLDNVICSSKSENIWLSCYDGLENSRLNFKTFKEEFLKVSYPDSLEGNEEVARADLIAETFGIAGTEKEFLRLFVLTIKHTSIKDLFYNCLFNSYRLKPQRYGMCRKIGYIVKASGTQVEKALSVESNLVSSGLIELDSDFEVKPTNSLIKLVLIGSDDSDLRSILLSKVNKASLSLTDFDFLEENYKHISNLLEKTLEKKAKGVNILFYGRPGTGKTELAKTICSEIGADLYSCSDLTGRSSVGSRKANARVDEALAAMALTKSDHRSVLIFDEAEDVFNRESLKNLSKLFINQLLEENQTPVIWTTNSIDNVNPAHLRRFSFALEMRTPPVKTRARVWRSELDKNGIELPEEEIEELSRVYELPPSYTSSSVRAAALTGDSRAIVKTLNNMEAAATGEYRPVMVGAAKKKFDSGLLKADVDLEKFGDRIERLKIKNFSLCLYGPPGTGKSEYARHLANLLGMEVLKKKASDLKSMWVGETESNIADAFREAAYGHYFMIFDEVDSLLRDRVYAHNSWEVTEVNEMLTQMENHPLPFVCTTNLFETLDKASLRRFTFKIRLDFMDRAMVIRAFSHFFGVEHDPGLKRLTPGDFALVAKKAGILGLTSPAEISKLLAQEASFKGETIKRIGF